MYNVSGLALLGALLISGCSYTPIYIWYISTENLIKQHDYQKAIEQIRTETPHNKKALTSVTSLAKQHLIQQNLKINKLIRHKEWGQARAIVRHLTLTQPKNVSLVHLQESIDKALKEEERLLNTHLYLVKADLLDIQFKQQALANRIHHDRFNWFNQSFHLEEQKQNVAEKLLQLSTQALLVKDYGSAQQTYERAIEFDNQLGKGEIKQAIDTGLSVTNEEAILQRQRSLVKQLVTAISNLNFQRVLKIQEILSHKPFHGPKVKSALKQAHRLRQEYANTLDNDAAKLYRQGDIPKSVELWLMALTLTPDNNSIKEKLLRAQKVQHKLEKLSRSYE